MGLFDRRRNPGSSRRQSFGEGNGIRERYIVQDDNGSTMHDSRSDADYRASISGAGAKVLDLSTYTNPTFLQRMTGARPGDAARKAEAREAKIRKTHSVYDSEGKSVGFYAKDQAGEAKLHADSVGGKVVTKTTDRNRPFIPRYSEKEW